jgi:DNA primase
VTTTTTTRWRERLDEARRRYALPDVLEASGVALRRGGPGIFWGLCPFHADRRPSFFVDVRTPQNPHFYCFGCAARGDIVDFVRRRDGLATLGEALARLTGTPPPPAARVTGIVPGPSTPERKWDHLTLEEQLVLNTTVTLYQHALRHNWRALAYLHSRGVSDEVIDRCGLGYADGHSLEGHLRRHGGLKLAETLGLLRRSASQDGGKLLRERFAGRIVVPELRGGKPIWLIGRRPDERSQVKYLALPGQRPILGLEHVLGRREVFVIEGVFDWLTAVERGLPACSPCGTAVPAERLHWLYRAAIVWGIFDADRGGRQGAARYGAALGDRFRPLALPEASDLNDLGCRMHGRAIFFQLLAMARRQDRDRREAPCSTTSPNELQDLSTNGAAPQ